MLEYITIISKDESFDFVPPGCSPSVVFTLRRLHPDVYEEIESKYRKKERIRRTGQVVEQVPASKRGELAKDIMDYSILAWRGVVDMNGAPVPCTKEHKWLLPPKYKIAISEATDEGNLSGMRQREDIQEVDDTADPTPA